MTEKTTLLRQIRLVQFAQTRVRLHEQMKNNWGSPNVFPTTQERVNFTCVVPQQ